MHSCSQSELNSVLHSAQMNQWRINLAGILGYAGADPEGLVGGKGGMWGECTSPHRGKGLRRGLGPS